MFELIEVHPVQAPERVIGGAASPKVVTMAAYEVYCEIHGPQEAMITGNCRGGFSAGELIAFLYARSFPKSQWRARASEAMRGAKGL